MNLGRGYLLLFLHRKEQKVVLLFLIAKLGWLVT